jgi:ribosomal protein S18 acetylase RimI-like enzyme
MLIEQIQDRDELEGFLRRDAELHLYGLGDLDDFFWPLTTCYGLKTPQGISRVVVIYRGPGLPVLLALGREDLLEKSYFEQLQSLLPNRFYAHLSPGLEKRFNPHYSVQDFGPHCKMALASRHWQSKVSVSGTFQLKEKHLPEIMDLYQQSYPDNAFDTRMLETGKYFGAREQGRLVSIAGVHVFSEVYRVATLGNITTHPDHRNQGFGRKVTARLCQELSGEVDFIGLNVKIDNQSAISLYQSLGFKMGPRYGEYALKRRI